MRWSSVSFSSPSLPLFFQMPIQGLCFSCFPRLSLVVLPPCCLSKSTFVLYSPLPQENQTVLYLIAGWYDIVMYPVLVVIDLGTHSDWKWGDGKRFHANGNQKKAGVPILISNKIDFKIKNVTRDKEGHYIMIRGLIQEEDITIINIYAPNIGAPQYNKATANSYKRGNRQ